MLLKVYYIQNIIYTPLVGKTFGSLPFATSSVAAATNLPTTIKTF
jgi:hypothetical protein